MPIATETTEAVAATVDSDALWQNTLPALKATLGQNSFNSWIEPLELSIVSDGAAVFTVPTNFIGNYVSQNFGDEIVYHLNRHGADVERIQFKAPEQTKSEVQETAKKPARKSVESGSTLDQRLTFDAFVVGRPNELAYAAARRVTEGGPTTFNPLFLQGGVGLGKTHLMHAIAHELQARSPELNVFYLSAEQFMYRFIASLRERKMMDFKRLFRSVDVLLIDDIQFITGKDKTQEEFLHTFDALADQHKQIIVSADRPPSAFKDMDERIKSRLEVGLVVDVLPIDPELGLNILRSKIGQYSIQYPGLEIAEGVLEFLARRITSNVRVLEGALTRLFAFASLIGKEVTLELTQDCLSDMLKAADRTVTVEEIKQKVCEHYHIRLSDLIGPKRLRIYARPRQAAMYLAKSMTSMSLPEIGRRLGGRDHTTIMYGVRKIEELMSSDAQITDDLDQLKRKLTE